MIFSTPSNLLSRFSQSAKLMSEKRQLFKKFSTYATHTTRNPKYCLTKTLLNRQTVYKTQIPHMPFLAWTLLQIVAEILERMHCYFVRYQPFVQKFQETPDHRENARKVSSAHWSIPFSRPWQALSTTNLWSTFLYTVISLHTDDSIFPKPLLARGDKHKEFQ